MKKIIFKNIDGSCGIITPTEAALQILTIEEIAQKDVPAGLEYRITEAENIPTDRTFRNAWTDDNETETVDINMEKAREIHMNKIRNARNEMLKDLDVDYIKAIELELTEDQQTIAFQKQILRDIPQNTNLEEATTPEELKSIWPVELG